MEKENKEIQREIKKIGNKQQNKTIMIILVLIGVFILAFVVWIVISNTQSHFEYKGVSFEITKEIAPYRTNLPEFKSSVTGWAIMTDNNYYFYLRNDPRKLDNISFNGEIILRKDVVINSTGDFMCGGKGILGITNLVRLYNGIGANVIKDQNATCDEQGRYMLLQIEAGNETRIDQNGPSCYLMQINNCEILEATERFMVETFSKVNEITKK